MCTLRRIERSCAKIRRFLLDRCESGVTHACVLNSYSAKVSLFLKATADTDEGNPWIVTYGIASLTIPLGDMTAWVTSTLEWVFRPWNNSNTQTAVTSGLGAILANQYSLYRADIAARDAAGPGNSTVVRSVNLTGSNLAGIRTRSVATAAPQPLCLVIRKNTTTPGRKGRGRSYLPCYVQDFNTDGQTNPDTNLTNAITAYSTFISSTWTPSTGGTYGYVLIGSDGTNRPISSATLSPYAGVQRRRLR